MPLQLLNSTTNKITAILTKKTNTTTNKTTAILTKKSTKRKQRNKKKKKKTQKQDLLRTWARLLPGPRKPRRATQATRPRSPDSLSFLWSGFFSVLIFFFLPSLGSSLIWVVLWSGWVFFPKLFFFFFAVSAFWVINNNYFWFEIESLRLDFHVDTTWKKCHIRCEQSIKIKSQKLDLWTLNRVS